MKQSVAFYSEGVQACRRSVSCREDLRAGDRRAGIVLCHGYTGVRTSTCRTTPAC